MSGLTVLARAVRQVVASRSPTRQVIAAGMVGRKGDVGPAGPAFSVDATGLLADRALYDDEAVGFAFLDTATGLLYFREGAAGGWSGGTQFQGPAGVQGPAGATGAQGVPGAPGADGLDGVDGADGRGVVSTAVNGAGHLIITYSDASTADAGAVVGASGATGATGAAGRGISSTAINGSNHLIITYSDGDTSDAGLVAGTSPAWGGIIGSLASQTDLQAALDGKASSAQGAKADSSVQSSEKGAALGVATLDSGGKVPAAQLPSYVDDVIEAANYAALPATGDAGKIYVTLDTNKTWRWSGSSYVEISASPGSTDAVTEGATNLYFTAARVRAAALTGLSLADTAVVAAADSILQAIGKLAARLATAFDRSNHTGTQTAATISDFSEAAQDAIAALLVAGTNVTLSYNDAGSQLTINVSTPAAAPAVVITDATTARTSVLADASEYLRFTNAAATTYTVQPQASVAWPADAEVHIRRAAAANLTLTPGAGVTLNAPSGGTLVMTNAMSVTLKRVGADVWDVIGQTVAA